VACKLIPSWGILRIVIAPQCAAMKAHKRPGGAVPACRLADMMLLSTTLARHHLDNSRQNPRPA